MTRRIYLKLVLRRIQWTYKDIKNGGKIKRSAGRNESSRKGVLYCLFLVCVILIKPASRFITVYSFVIFFF